MKNLSRFIVILLISSSAFAQTTKTSQTTSVDVFGTTPIEEIEDVEATATNNCIKWNIGMLSRGIFMFDYERQLTDWMSGEVGLGYTYLDYSYELFNIEDNYLAEGELTTPTGGLAFEAGLRFYPGQLGNLEGFYFSPVYRYRDYNFETNINYDSGNENIVNTNYTFNEYGFLCGAQAESWLDLITFDYYAGVIFRKGENVYYADNKLITDKISEPSFVCGIRIGVPF